MCPRSPQLIKSLQLIKSPQRIKNRQEGLGLVGAIVVIVIISLMSVAMARMLHSNSESFSYDIIGLKAFHAAESGAHLGLNRAIPPSGGGSCADRTFNFTDTPLGRCSATVSCVSQVVNADTFYILTSVGQCGGGDVVAQRTVQVRVQL